MVAAVPPMEVWLQFVAIESNYFKKSLADTGRRPFPHMTLTHSLGEVWEAFTQQLSVRPSFSASLEGLNRFANNKSSVIYVPVDGELVELKRIEYSTFTI